MDAILDTVFLYSTEPQVKRGRGVPRARAVNLSGTREVTLRSTSLKLGRTNSPLTPVP